MEQFNQTIGARVEAVTILGGDYGAAGGLYTFRGGTLADVSIAKIGGGGNVASPGPLGWGDVSWAPVLLGNLGHLSAVNTFQQGYLQGNQMQYDTLAAQLGGGARFYFTEHPSLAGNISGIYGHVENEFVPKNAIGEAVHELASGTLVDWDLDTWSVAPSPVRWLGLGTSYFWGDHMNGWSAGVDLRFQF